MKITECTIHSDLTEEHYGTGWHPGEPTSLECAELAKLEALAVKRLLREGEDIDDVYPSFGREMLGLIEAMSCNAWLFEVSGLVLTKGRVRSYKGLFPYRGKIKEGRYVEVEMDVTPLSSYFVGLALVNERNSEECVKLTFAWTNAVLILTPEDDPLALDRSTLLDLVIGLRIGSDVARIDQKRFMPQIASKSHACAILYPDQKEKYVTFTAIYPKAGTWRSRFNNLLDSAGWTTSS